MKEQGIAAIDKALREGSAPRAMEAARKLCAEGGLAPRDAAIEIAKAAASVYRDLISPPVQAFAEAAATELPPDVGPVVVKALQRLIKLTADWEAKLWAVHTERLVREVREWTRMKVLDSAQANVGRLMALVPEEQRTKRAQYIGAVLATLLNNQKEAQQLIAGLGKNPGAFNLNPALVEAMEASRAKRSGEMIGVNLETIEREYTSTLAQVVVDIKSLLPEATKMGEPEEALLRDLGDVFRSLLRVPIQAEELDLLLDATNILVDFIPKEQTSTAKIARVEARVYGQLGFTAKKAVLLTFQDLGRNRFFTTIYKGWAKGYISTDAILPIVELMGALRTPEFNEFLAALKNDKRVSPNVSTASSTAQAAIGGMENADQLMSELRGLFGKRRQELADLKRAEMLITALGLVVKSPRTETQDRHKLLEFLRSHVPEDLHKLAMHTALQAFTVKVDEQQPGQTQWAIRVLVRALWIPDETTVHHKGGERQASELGFRAEVVEALAKIGSRDIPSLVRSLEPLTMRFSVGFMAAAEVCEKLRDPQLLLPLERMLNVTLTHSDAGNVYQQEYYWDAAAQERKPVTREKLLVPIVYAIGQIGGEQSKLILHRYQEQIASGKAPQPSAQIASFMAQFMGGNAVLGANTSAFNALENPDAEAAPVDPSELKPLLKQLTGWYLLSGSSTRRAKKVEALIRLAQLGSVEAIDPVIKQCADKDAMVVGAAINCLVECAGLGRAKQLRDMTINMVLDALNSKDPAVRQGAVRVLKDVGPNRKDVREKITAFAKTAERRETKDALATILKGGHAGGEAPPAEKPVEKKEGPLSVTDKMELKRAYMAQRKAWIDGGKKGDPPVMPPGLD